MVRNTYIFPPEPSMRIIADIFSYLSTVCFAAETFIVATLARKHSFIMLLSLPSELNWWMCDSLSIDWITALPAEGMYDSLSIDWITAVPAEGNGDLQTLICVLGARPRRCSTLSNPVPWQNWMAAYLGYTLQMKMLFPGWRFVTHIREEEE